MSGTKLFRQRQRSDGYTFIDNHMNEENIPVSKIYDPYRKEKDSECVTDYIRTALKDRTLNQKIENEEDRFYGKYRQTTIRKLDQQYGCNDPRFFESYLIDPDFRINKERGLEEMPLRFVVDMEAERGFPMPLDDSNVNQIQEQESHAAITERNVQLSRRNFMKRVAQDHDLGWSEEIAINKGYSGLYPSLKQKTYRDTFIDPDRTNREYGTRNNSVRLKASGIHSQPYKRLLGNKTNFSKKNNIYKSDNYVGYKKYDTHELNQY